MSNTKPPIRQGDVLLLPVATMPDGCEEVPNDNGRIVLAYGEVTGHAHAIADHQYTADQRERFLAMSAEEMAQAAIARAKLYRAPNGDRYLEIKHEAVTLRHEEHSAHTLPPGIYKLPTQVEYTPAELRRVAD